MAPRVLTVLLVALCAVADPVAADTRIDLIDHMFGASNTNAVGGHGRLTIGVSRDGDLTVLSWPSPSLRDHLTYVSSNALDAHDLSRRGAHPGMGSYLGLLVETAGGTELTWLRDAPWTSSQSYSGPYAPVPVTQFGRADLGLTVTVYDIVSPDVDVLTRRMIVERSTSSPVVAVQLVVYENLAPSVSRIPQLPLGDWALDPVNDYLAMWDDTAGAILHFHPEDRAAFVNFFELINLDADVDYGAAEALMQSAAPAPADVQALVDSIDDEFLPGVAALVTTEPAPVAHQVGTDATPLCGFLDDIIDNLLALPQTYPDAEIPLDDSTANALRCEDPLPRLRADHGWQWAPEDALADLADGSLSGSGLAAARTNGALVTPLSFDGDAAEAAAVFAFGATRADARAALDSAQTATAAERLAAAEAAAEAELAPMRLPDPALGDLVVDVARRALVNLYVARDRDVGAIVASVTRQPPYYLDWPRDGAFFTAALDVGGRSDWASQRMRWYATTIRPEYTEGLPVLTPDVPIDPDDGRQLFPKDVWEMNYYSDGTVGGPIRFEIDNTALHVWSVASHAASLEPAARGALLDDIWPTTRDALVVLERWREPDTGLPAPANEDDHLELTSTLHAAVTVHAALVAGTRLAHDRGETDFARRLADRAADLAAATVEHYFDPDAGLFHRERDGAGGPGGGATAWLVWPGRVLPSGDPRVQAQLDADMTRALSILRGETGGGSYVAKNVVSAALYGAEGGARDDAREAVALLAAIATPDTHHFGEVYVVDGNGDWSNRVAPPHVWEGALFYLAAMALSEPERFNLEETALPLPPDDGGCGCRAAPSGRLHGGAAALLAGLLALRRRRRQRAVTDGRDRGCGRSCRAP